MITQGNPGYTLGFQNLGYFGRLFLYSTNINENTQGNPGVPWVIASFGIPWVFKAFYVFKYTTINFE